MVSSRRCLVLVLAGALVTGGARADDRAPPAGLATGGAGALATGGARADDRAPPAGLATGGAGALVTGGARADDRAPPAGLATGLGAGLALTSLALGGSLFASSDDDALHRSAVYVMMAGLTAAPALSHLIVREYTRAALFSIIPACALIANAVVMSVDPEVTTNGSATTRSVFGVALTVGVVGAALGIADTLGAGDRFFARHPHLRGRF